MRKWWKGMMAALLAFGLAVPAASANTGPPQDIRVMVDGKLVEFPDEQPYIDPATGRTLVPLKFVGEALGVEVNWDQANKVVKMKKDKFALDLPIGKTRIDKGSYTFRFETPAVLKGDRTFVPLRFVSEVFGGRVIWDGKERTVKIDSVWNPLPEDLHLLPKDPVAYPVMVEFVNSLKIEGNTVVGKMPKAPKGYRIVVTYKDSSDGQWGNRANDIQDLQGKYKPGETFKVPFVGEGGRLIFAVYLGGQGKGSVVIGIPTLTEQWGIRRD